MANLKGANGEALWRLRRGPSSDLCVGAGHRTLAGHRPRHLSAARVGDGRARIRIFQKRGCSCGSRALLLFGGLLSRVQRLVQARDHLVDADPLAERL